MGTETDWTRSSLSYDDLIVVLRLYFDSVRWDGGGDGTYVIVIALGYRPCRKHSPYRLVVRTSRRGHDNPGSTPGEDI